METIRTTKLHPNGDENTTLYPETSPEQIKGLLDFLSANNISTFAVGNVTNLPTGSKPTVTFRKGDNITYMDFGIPEGSQGRSITQIYATGYQIDSEDPNYTSTDLRIAYSDETEDDTIKVYAKNGEPAYSYRCTFAGRLGNLGDFVGNFTFYSSKNIFESGTVSYGSFLDKINAAGINPTSIAVTLFGANQGVSFVVAHGVCTSSGSSKGFRMNCVYSYNDSSHTFTKSTGFFAASDSPPATVNIFRTNV